MKKQFEEYIDIGDRPLISSEIVFSCGILASRMANRMVEEQKLARVETSYVGMYLDGKKIFSVMDIECHAREPEAAQTK